jgi:hypothetical protein
MLDCICTSQVPNTAEDERLENLPGAKLKAVQWDPDRTCLPGTRQQLLNEIIEWAHSPAEHTQIFWLSGAAGTGKSSIANSIAQQFYSLGRLGASFRFDRDVAQPETPGQLFGNLCHQLALFDDQLRTAVLSAIHHGCGGAMALRMQARTLLVETAQSAEIVGPVLIVIDALDESGVDGHQPEPNRQTLVRAIVKELPALPPSIKVLITSRDEGIISQLMRSCPSCLRRSIDIAPDTEEDILQYIQHRMGQICSFLPDLSDNWPGAAKEAELAHYADGLFIWASVACKFLQTGGGDPDILLDDLLTSPHERVTAEAKLDHLFLDVLQHSLPVPEGIQKNNWHYIVGSIVALKTPLTYRDLNSLLGLSDKSQTQTMSLLDGSLVKLKTSFYIISSLRPILRIDPDLKNVVRLLHKSVFDFLTCRANKSFRIDLQMQNAILAMQCLSLMNQNLRYDICGIVNRSLLNSEIDGLPGLIHDCIPEALRYACHFFAYHLNDVAGPPLTLMEELHKFVTQKLMHWVETMSLLYPLHEAEICLQILSDYLKVSCTNITVCV